MRVSVVVPVYNGEETLAQCLTALSSQTLPRDEYEIIVIDDGSTDRTAEIALEYDVRLISIGSNQGRIIARMTGAQEAQSELLAFCDSRVICEETVLETALNKSTKPSYMGSDMPDEWFKSIFGNCLFAVQRRLWPTAFPQEWHNETIQLSEGNFDKIPKGFGFFVCDRDFFLRHIPENKGKDVNDDTLLFSSMIREAPLTRDSRLRCKYLQRTDFLPNLRHIFKRGALFDSYYLRPPHPFFYLYLGLWATFLTLIFLSASSLISLKQLLACGTALYACLTIPFYVNPRNYLIFFIFMPFIAASFGLGIVAAQTKRMIQLITELARHPGQVISKRFFSWLCFGGILVLGAIHIRNKLPDLMSIPPVSLWAFILTGAAILLVQLINGYIMDLMVKPLGVKITWLECILLSLSGAFGNLVLPARAGLLIRGTFLRRKGLLVSAFAGAVGGTYMVSLSTQLVLAVAAILQNPGLPKYVTLPVYAGLVGIMCLAIGALLLPIKYFAGIQVVATVLGSWKQIANSPTILFQTFILCLLNVLISTTQMYFVFHFLGSGQPFQSCLLICSAGALFSMLAVTPGGIGFFEIPALALSEILGIPSPISLAAVLIFRITDVAITLFAGGLSSWLLVRQTVINADA